MSDFMGQVTAAVTTWLVGETGRAVVAGGFGGAMRWLSQERRRVREGVIAVISGALAAVYLAPVMMAMMRVLHLDLGDGPRAWSAAAFLTGLAGMSLAKIVVAMVETWATTRRPVPGAGGDPAMQDDEADHGPR